MSYAPNQDSDGLGRAEGRGWRAVCHPLLVVVVRVPPDPTPAPTSGSETGSRGLGSMELFMLIS